MTFDEALDAADVPRPDVKAFRHDAYRAWLVVGSVDLEVRVVRAVLRRVVDADAVVSAHALGGDRAVRDLLASVGELGGGVVA